MDNLVFNILVAVIVAMIGVIVKELLPYLQKEKERALLELRQTKWAWAADIVDTVVRAVEQTVSDQLHGEDKKDEAIRWIRKLTYSAGIQLTDDQVNTMIEAAVQAMNEGKVYEPTTLSPCIGFVPPTEEKGDEPEE